MTSAAYCLSKSECRPFIKFLLDSTMVLDAIPAGLDHVATAEMATIHRIGNKILHILLESSPEMTGKLLTEIKKDEINERELTREQ